MVSTVERRMGQIDKIIDHCSNNRSKQNSRNRDNLVVKTVLRIGVAQLAYMTVPSYAAVKETVEVLKTGSWIISETKIKFVNAILRRVARETNIMLNLTSVQDNAAPWLVQEWKATWGPSTTKAILKAAMKRHSHCISVNGYRPDSSTPQQLVQSITATFSDATILPQGSIRINQPPHGDISSWPKYDDGLWWIQDPSATLPALALYQELCQNKEKPVADMAVVDMCAAPGGKTAQLSSLGFGSVTAIDISEQRSKRLRRNMARLQMNWDVVVADGKTWVPSNKVDGVLLDVPCTATGTASKRPDVLRRSADYLELLDTQYKLACHAADKILAPGGTMIYATCSLLKQESEHQIQHLVQRSDGEARLSRIPFLPGDLPGFDSAIDIDGCIRVLPGTVPKDPVAPCDGFFVAKLRRET